jgi:D-serine deaminase-like pyridoxal phosphate-dependent protein
VKPGNELLTPALLLDLEVLRRNLSIMQERMRSLSTNLRAHVKVHKSPHIACMQIEAGAIGAGTATVWEAIVMARAGISDIFVINQFEAYHVIDGDHVVDIWPVIPRGP